MVSLCAGVYKYFPLTFWSPDHTPVTYVCARKSRRCEASTTRWLHCTARLRAFFLWWSWSLVIPFGRNGIPLVSVCMIAFAWWLDDWIAFAWMMVGWLDGWWLVARQIYTNTDCSFHPFHPFTLYTRISPLTRDSVTRLTLPCPHSILAKRRPPSTSSHSHFRPQKSARCSVRLRD